jgi:hypothetical protein
MKMSPAYYSEEEKDLIINHLVLHKENGKKRFEQYIKDFISTYGIHVEKFQDKNKSKNVNPLTNTGNWEYSAEHMLWNNEINDNVVTAVLGHPNNSLIKNLRKLKPNWNHINNEGNNALHFLAKQGEITHLKELLVEYEMNINAINKDNDYFSYILFKSSALPLIKQNDPVIQSKIMTYLENIENLILTFPNHFKNIQLDKLKEIQQSWNETKSVVQSNEFLNVPNRQYPQYVKETTLGFEKVDKLLNYYYLQITINNSEKQTIKKAKI